jgi:flavin-dependent dehydrogenase
VRYDAVIVGASFAGLAVANELTGKRVLLIDRKEIGTRQTSACGTILAVVEKLGCLDSLLQIHDTIVLHTASRVIEFKLVYPFCTFDYNVFCQMLAHRSGADFLKATAKGVNGDIVLTDKGEFRTNCIVDASGWRAVLASSLQVDFVDWRGLSFGLETVVEYQDDSLHFWYDPHILPRGVTWVFPCGRKSFIGIGSYLGKTNLKGRLAAFLRGLELRMDSLHGGYFPHTLREPTVGNLFLVGDAAGQCLGLTAEGIRQALYFGQACGHIVRKVIEREIPLEAGLQEYRRFVGRHEKYFKFFSGAQRILTKLPNSWITWIAVMMSKGRLLHYMMREYEKIAEF